MSWLIGPARRIQGTLEASNTTSSTKRDSCMRLITRAAFVTAASIPLVLATSGVASAAEATDVTYAFDVEGSTLTNTITNNSGGPLTCTTTVASAPEGELPPVAELSDQTLVDNGTIEPGVTSQTLPELPDGTYVALATCVGEGEQGALWVSDYPAIEETLELFPNESFAVGETSPVIDVPAGEAAASAIASDETASDENASDETTSDATPSDEVATGSAGLPSIRDILSNIVRFLTSGSAS